MSGPSYVVTWLATMRTGSGTFEARSAGHVDAGIGEEPDQRAHDGFNECVADPGERSAPGPFWVDVPGARGFEMEWVFAPGGSGLTSGGGGFAGLLALPLPA